MEVIYEFPFENCPDCPLCSLKVKRERGTVTRISCKHQKDCLDERSEFYKRNRLGQKRKKG